MDGLGLQKDLVTINGVPRFRTDVVVSVRLFSPLHLGRSDTEYLLFERMFSDDYFLCRQLHMLKVPSH